MKNLLLIALLALVAFNGLAYYQSGNIPLRDWGQQVARDGLSASLKNFSFSKTLSQTQQGIRDLVDGQAPAAEADKLQIYKWTDGQGVVHYHNKPVPGATAITIDPNANILPMAEVPEIAPLTKPEVDLNQNVQENREKIRREMEARAGI